MLNIILQACTQHWLAATKDAMKMQLRLTYNSMTIIDHNPKERQWWITGFNPYYQNVRSDCLKATFKVKFHNAGMFKAFYNCVASRHDSETTFNYKTQVATIKF